MRLKAAGKHLSQSKGYIDGDTSQVLTVSRRSPINTAMGDGGVWNNIRATSALSQVYERAFIRFKSSSPEKISDLFCWKERLFLQASRDTDLQVLASLNQIWIYFELEGLILNVKSSSIVVPEVVGWSHSWDLGAASSPSDADWYRGLIVLSTISPVTSSSV
jgi:hypothetical protein